MNVVWEANNTQAVALVPVMQGGAEHILGFSCKTCNEAVRGDMGIDTVEIRIS